MTTLQGRRVAVLAASIVERSELEQPRHAVRDAGATVDVVFIQNCEIDAREHHLDHAGTIAGERSLSEGRGSSASDGALAVPVRALVRGAARR